MKVEIDKYAGFCFGVTKSINMAEKEISNSSSINCLGNIVHNSMEENRLLSQGMKTISHDDFNKMSGENILIRAHGEPPSTYEKAKEKNLKIIDATCPVVLKLQNKIKTAFLRNPNSQIVIYGKKGHAEVNGLVGQTLNKAIVISNIDEAKSISTDVQTFLFSQTTSNFIEYEKIGKLLYENFEDKSLLNIFQTICPSVKNRIPRLETFSKNNEIIIFVSDNKSSNGKMLYEICKSNNPSCYFINSFADLKEEWFRGVNTVGISGATSTPMWLMQEVKQKIEELNP